MTDLSNIPTPTEMYEAAKLSWLSQNVGCTPEEYTAAMRALADEFGV